MSKKGKATKMGLNDFLSSTPGPTAHDALAHVPSQPGEALPADDGGGRFGRGGRFGGDRFGDRRGGDRYPPRDRRDYPSEQGSWSRRGYDGFDRPRGGYEDRYGPRGGSRGGPGRSDDFPPIGGDSRTDDAGWKRRDFPPIDSGAPAGRPQLNLKPRTLPVTEKAAPAASQASKRDPFGGAKPVSVKPVETGVERLSVNDRESSPAGRAPTQKSNRWDNIFSERKPGSYQPRVGDGPRDGPRDRDALHAANDRWGRSGEYNRETRGPRDFDRRESDREHASYGRRDYDLRGPDSRRGYPHSGENDRRTPPAAEPAVAPEAEKPTKAEQQPAEPAEPAKPAVDLEAKAEQEREQREQQEKEKKLRAEKTNAQNAVQSGKTGSAFEDELRTSKPTPSGAILLEAILNHISQPEDGKWAEAGAYGAVLQKLLANSIREQVRAIYAVQKYCHEQGFPKAGESNLVEVLFTALYINEICFDDSFMTWKDEEVESVPGKQKAIIQTLSFISMLEEAEEEYDEEGGSDLEDEDLLPVAL